MRRAEVLVVGGGPAGSSCARALVARGVDVLVVDRARFPRDKTCAGWITPAVVDRLALAVDEYAAAHVCQPITGFATGVMGGPLVETRFDEVVSYGIRRIEFDAYLLARSGAATIEASPVSRIERVGGMWRINDELEAPMLVGAGGHFCPVARHLGAVASAEPAVAAQEIEFRMTPDQAAACRVRPDTPELHLCRDLRGYGWVFRKGDCLNVGLGRQDAHELPAHVRAFVDSMTREGAVPPGAPGRWKGHAYLLRDLSPRRAVSDGVLLVGDAAGLAATVSGEGIRPAVESGQLAADIIAEASGDYRAERLRRYDDGLKALVPRGSYGALAAIPSAMLVPVVSKLLATGWFTRRVLLERWFLQAA